MAIFVWRLADPAGIETRCTLVPGEDDSCELRIEQGDRVIHTELHANADTALLKAEALWIECQLDGWTE